MDIFYVILPVLLLAVAGTEGRRVTGESCAAHVPCCGGLTCDKVDAMWGLCKKSGSAGSPQPYPLPSPSPPAPTRSSTGSSSSGYLVTKDEFRHAVTTNGYGPPSDEQYENINKRAFNGKITTKREMAMFLAYILHESGGLKFKEEIQHILSTDPAYPGKNYHGRGYIQLSHMYNYREASMALYGDLRLAQNPEQVATNDATAWDTAFWYWASRVHNQAGVAEGKFGVTIRAIDGGFECDGEYKHQARRRFSIYTKILNIFVPGENPIESGCYN